MQNAESSTPQHRGSDRATETTPLISNGSSASDEVASGKKHWEYWQEAWKIVKFSLPVLGSQLLEFSLVIVEVVSVGHLSTTALAAVSLGSMTANVTGMSMIQGLSSALETLLPSAHTSSHPELVGLWSQRMVVVIAIAIVPILVLWFNAEQVLLHLKQEPEIARLAALYLRWVALGLPAIGFNSIARRYFQSQGLFGVQTRIMLIVAPINVLLNYLLVWGPEPIRLGFVGAPISTAISFTLVSFISIYYGIFLVPRTAWHPMSSKMFKNLGIVTRLGLYGVVQMGTEWWAWELLALVASLIGPIELAAQSIILTSATTTFQAGFALSGAAAVRVGNLLGAKDARRAAIAAKVSILLALAVSSVISFNYMVFRKSWAHIFNNDPEVVAIVSSVLPLLALFQVVDEISTITGALMRTMGKQFMGALLNVCAYYVLGLPIGIWLAFSKHLGLEGLWIGVTVAMFLCSVVGTVICLKTDWNYEVLKIQDRISREERLRKLPDEEDSQRSS